MAFILTPLKALKDAEKAGLLHRDISFNNIMLNDNGKVVVNDWDHAGLIRDESGQPHQAFRTVGTSLFIVCDLT